MERGRSAGAFLKESVFQLIFKSTNSGRVANVCWKGVPDHTGRCLTLQGPLSGGSCADSGDSEAFLLTIPERTRRLIKSEQRLKIRSKRGVETTDSERCDFVFYSEFDRKLLKFRHEWSGKIFFSDFRKTGLAVLFWIC